MSDNNKSEREKLHEANEKSAIIVSQTQPETLNTKHEAEKMETHAHHLHKAPGHGLRHYFFEFLMLFLAVFCGFLAENFREHQVEQQQAKQFMKSMIEDLANDTANLAAVIEKFQSKQKRLDTALLLYHDLSNGYNPVLRRNIQVVLGFPDFIKTDRTMQNLKNSGSMRLIQQKKAANGITEYDQAIRNLEIYVAGLQDIFNDVRRSWYEIFDDAAIEADKKIKTDAELELGKNTYLLKTDRALLGRFNNEIRDFRLVTGFVVEKEIKLKSQATELIALLKKEYHLN
jgi:hypothetical protein